MNIQSQFPEFVGSCIEEIDLIVKEGRNEYTYNHIVAAMSVGAVVGSVGDLNVTEIDTSGLVRGLQVILS